MIPPLFSRNRRLTEDSKLEVETAVVARLGGNLGQGKRACIWRLVSPLLRHARPICHACSHLLAAGSSTSTCLIPPGHPPPPARPRYRQLPTPDYRDASLLIPDHHQAPALFSHAYLPHFTTTTLF
ncbi:hypothetical protein GY45DRAFT_678274 [Cubamyces sp. BRFM 1775]|nr:hypothetical protein GY45DRAFT_678274 [Cubamyces sp. BRFM 1775]